MRVGLVRESIEPGMNQELQVIERTEEGFETTSVLPVRFVPMTGETRKKPPKGSGLDSHASGSGPLVVAGASLESR